MRVGSRVKVIDKGGDGERHYGRVGSVIAFVAAKAKVRFDDGSQGLFFSRQLREVGGSWTLENNEK